MLHYDSSIIICAAVVGGYTYHTPGVSISETAGESNNSGEDLVLCIPTTFSHASVDRFVTFHAAAVNMHVDIMLKVVITEKVGELKNSTGKLHQVYIMCQ